MKPCFIIAEAGVNHNGSLGIALKLVDEAAKAGADAIKFQSFKANLLVTKKAHTADYQHKNTGIKDQYSMLKKLEMSFEFHEKVVTYCKKQEIAFMSTPFDEESAKYLIDFGVEALKVPSGELTNTPFLKALCVYNKPIILSTGMASLEEVAQAVDLIKAERLRLHLTGELSNYLTLLHCTSNYPAKYEDVNLTAMNTMAKQFELPVGYSDHTNGLLVSLAAVAMGARVIEKHFTLDCTMEGPDHKASLEPDQLSEMINQIRLVERCFGNGEKEPRDSELPVRELVRRSVTLASDLPANKPIEAKDVVLLRPGTGIPPKDLEKVIGRSLKLGLVSGTQIKWKDLA